eukprot:356244-Chlamydomonas_euryale.AAC.14
MHAHKVNLTTDDNCKVTVCQLCTSSVSLGMDIPVSRRMEHCCTCLAVEATPSGLATPWYEGMRVWGLGGAARALRAGKDMKAGKDMRAPSVDVGLAIPRPSGRHNVPLTRLGSDRVPARGGAVLPVTQDIINRPSRYYFAVATSAIVTAVRRPREDMKAGSNTRA